MKLADDYSAIMEAMRNVLNTSPLSSPAPPSALLGGGYSNENLKNAGLSFSRCSSLGLVL